MATYKQGTAEPSRPEIAPHGEYDARVAGAEETVAGSGADMIKLKLDITMPDGSKGPIVYENLVFSETASWKIDQFRAAIGEEVVEGEEVEVNADDLVDARCRVRLGSETHEGKKRNKVSAFIVPDAGKPF